MKRFLFFSLFLLLFFSCTLKSEIKKESGVNPEKGASISSTGEEKQPAVIPDKKAREEKEKGLFPLFGKLLSDIQIMSSSFNPSRGEKVRISYTLSDDAKVSVHVYDPDLGLIATLMGNELQKSGRQEAVWDGKDMKGEVVPDEAYFFTINAADLKGMQEVYDPTIFSGGIEHDIVKADIHPETNTITYLMPEMGRVQIRLGIHSGPLFRSLVDWEPRVAGEITEYWNGKDADDLIELREHPRFKMVVTYFTFPENSVITYGNEKIKFREYKRRLSQIQPVKEKMERIKPNGKISLHYEQLRVNDYCPKMRMTFLKGQQELKEEMPVIKGKTIVRVELDEKDNSYFTNQKYEICFFIDGEFYAEEEAGYSPLNWIWNPDNSQEGEHIITVNLSGFKDQIGVASRKVKIIK
jgi:hypothetical protein